MAFGRNLKRHLGRYGRRVKRFTRSFGSNFSKARRNFGSRVRHVFVSRRSKRRRYNKKPNYILWAAGVAVLVLFRVQILNLFHKLTNK